VHVFLGKFSSWNDPRARKIRPSTSWKNELKFGRSFFIIFSNLSLSFSKEVFDGNFLFKSEKEKYKLQTA
jgi:hypothetical protein